MYKIRLVFLAFEHFQPCGCIYKFLNKYKKITNSKKKIIAITYGIRIEHVAKKLMIHAIRSAIYLFILLNLLIFLVLSFFLLQLVQTIKSQ